MLSFSVDNRRIPMTKEQFILNELGIQVANLTIENASLKAQLNEAYQKITALENPEGGVADGDKDI